MVSRTDLLLAIDTSAGTSVAIVAAGQGILAEHTGADRMKHAEVIGRLIDQVMTDSKISPRDLTGVVAGIGPGPFTGLRVGIAAARTFALGIGQPVLPVVSHDALAYQHHHSGARGDVLVVSDARRGEVYWSLYHLEDGSIPRRREGPGLARPDALPYAGTPRLNVDEVSAGSLGLVALELLQAGKPFAADQAMYLRSPDVTVSSGVKRVTQ